MRHWTIARLCVMVFYFDIFFAQFFKFILALCASIYPFIVLILKNCGNFFPYFWGFVFSTFEIIFMLFPCMNQLPYNIIILPRCCNIEDINVVLVMINKWFNKSVIIKGKRNNVIKVHTMLDWFSTHKCTARFEVRAMEIIIIYYLL